ncbi:MAG: hypothetical protein AAFN38_24315 [Cyanobacteria bacterium J06560_5]
MKETQIYRWQIAFDLKRALEEAAKAEQISLAQLLERIVLDWLDRRSTPDKKEAEIQQALHQSAAQSFGTIHGGEPTRAQEASQRIKSKLREHSAN